MILGYTVGIAPEKLQFRHGSNNSSKNVERCLYLHMRVEFEINLL